jgi:hypothetical protein
MESLITAAARRFEAGEPLGALNRAALRDDAPALETTSPRKGAVFVRERARRTVRIEECEAHGLTCGLFDRACALEVVEVRRGEARARSVDLDPRYEVAGGTAVFCCKHRTGVDPLQSYDCP